MKLSNPNYTKNPSKKQTPHESPLRQRMREDMVLHNLSKNTRENYLNGVLKLAKYYMRSPDKIGEEEVRAFICHAPVDGASFPRGVYSSR